MARVNFSGKKSGTLWLKRPEGRSRESLLLEATNAVPGKTPDSGRRLLFSHVAFGQHSSWLVCSDQLGDIYLLDLARNKFSQMYRAGQAVTALCCCVARPSEVLLGLADHSLLCTDIDTGESVATLTGHEAAVKSLSIHSSGQLLLAVSSLDCILWDLDSFSRHRTLNGGQDVGIQDVFFLPLSNVIVTCFKDDSVHMWDVTTMEYLYHLPPPPLPPCPLHHEWRTSRYKAFATTQNGSVMVAGGKSPFLHVWDLTRQQLVKTVELPEGFSEVKQLLIPPHSQDRGSSKLLGVLAQDGVLRWLDMESHTLLTQTGSHDLPLSHAHSSLDRRYLAAISERGSLLLFDIAVLARKLNQSNAPVVKAKVCGEKENDAKLTNTERGRARRMRHNQQKEQYKSIYKPTILQPPSTEREEEEEGEQKTAMKGLDRGKLVAVLKEYGEYPAKYRPFIWQSLLQLPGNDTAYAALLERGTHSAYTNLHRVCPIRSQRLARVLQRTLSALAHWSPIFAETPYLPSLVFPFVKMFQNNQLVTFELLATFLTNWCGNWFDYFPNPPLNLLAMVENCLAHHDPSLLRHLISHNITSHHYAWPLMVTVFSEALNKSQWMRLWDHALSNHPGFLLLLTASLLTSSHSTLLHCTSEDDFQQFFRHPPALDVGVVIREAYRMQETMPSDIHPEKLLGLLVPLTRGTYPVFNHYPKFVVDYRAREREKIRKEEEEYLRERQSALEMERLREARRVEEGAWFRQQQLLLEAEEERRKTLAIEEARLTDQRTRLMAMKREMQVRELKMVDATRRDFLQHQQKVKEACIRRLDDQIKKRVVQREMETKEALDEAELKALELERQRVQLQHQLTRYQEEMLGQLEMAEEAEEQRNSLQQFERGEREREQLAAAQASLAEAQVRQSCLETVREVERRREEAREEERERQAEVVGDVEANRERMRELEGLTSQLEQTQLAPQAEGDREKTSLSGERSPTLSALLWSRRRDQLDLQEAELLRRVQGVREKVVDHMTRQQRSHDRRTMATKQ